MSVLLAPWPPCFPDGDANTLGVLGRYQASPGRAFAAGKPIRRVSSTCNGPSARLFEMGRGHPRTSWSRCPPFGAGDAPAWRALKTRRGAPLRAPAVGEQRAFVLAPWWQRIRRCWTPSTSIAADRATVAHRGFDFSLRLERRRSCQLFLRMAAVSPSRTAAARTPVLRVEQVSTGEVVQASMANMRVLQHLPRGTASLGIDESRTIAPAHISLCLKIP